MAFTEFYCDYANGSQMNGGSDSGAASFTDTNGNWDGTSVFTATKTVTGVSVGQFASVFNDGATTPVYIGRVTATNSSTITISTTAKIGTAPTSSATGRSIRVGGAWKGPNAGDGFPLSGLPVTTSLADASGNTPRINLYDGASYSISTGITWATAGPLRIQGFHTTAGDGYRATIDCSTNAITALTVSGGSQEVVDLIFVSSASSGTNIGLNLYNSNRCTAVRCVAHGWRGSGFQVDTFAIAALIECEAYDCNKANSSSHGGFICNSNGIEFMRCYAHDCASGVNAVGFRGTAQMSLTDCISESNAGSGVENSQSIKMVGCDLYNNTVDGARLANGSSNFYYVENCNFFKNGGWGINGSGSGGRFGMVLNCMFGSGTQANTSGTTTGLKSMTERYSDGTGWHAGSLSYTSDATPWNAPTTGDFRIIGAACRGTGRGSFTQTDGTNTGTVGSPDIGSAQASSAPVTRAY